MPENEIPEILPENLKEFWNMMFCPPVDVISDPVHRQKMEEHRQHCSVCCTEDAESWKNLQTRLKACLPRSTTPVPGEIRIVQSQRGGWAGAWFRNPPAVLVVKEEGLYLRCVPVHPFWDAAIPGDLLAEDLEGLPLVFAPAAVMELRPGDLGLRTGRVSGEVFKDVTTMLDDPAFYPETAFRILRIQPGDARVQVNAQFRKNAMACSRSPLFTLFRNPEALCRDMRKNMPAYRVREEADLNRTFLLATPPEESLPLAASEKNNILVRVAYLVEGKLKGIELMRAEVFSDTRDEKGFRRISGVFPRKLEGVCGSMLLLESPDRNLLDGEWLQTDGKSFYALFEGEILDGTPLLAVVVDREEPGGPKR